jgi:hypothetical protein
MGDDKPTWKTDRIRRSGQRFACTAARKARGTERTIAITVARPVSISVTGRRSAIRLVTGTRKASEVPSSPRPIACRKVMN